MKIKKIIFISMLVAIVLTVPGPRELSMLAGRTKPPLTLVVDAGHGGPDGGAEAADGTLEEDLNLSIAKAIQTEGEKRGIKVVMTRETPEGLYEKGNLEKKWSKLEDMQRRKELIEEIKADAVVSVHMNCYPQDASVRGAQTFYPKSGNAEVISASESLAESVQKSLTEGLDDGSNRTQLAKGDVYLLENPTVPTVLVECGFLSNSEDLARLKQEKWQKRIATCIIDGVQSLTEI